MLHVVDDHEINSYAYENDQKVKYDVALKVE